MGELGKRIEQLVARLTEPIPDPPRGKPKPQKSWQGLKPGDRLRSLDLTNSSQLTNKLTNKLTNSSAGQTQPVPVVGVVESCDSQGVYIRESPVKVVRWEDKGWKEHWEKVRRERGRGGAPCD